MLVRKAISMKFIFFSQTTGMVLEPHNFPVNQKNNVMNFENNNAKLSVWRDVVLFLSGVLILSFMPKLQKDDMPDPDGKKVWNYITATSNYENWNQWPGYDGMYEGQSPHGAFLNIIIWGFR